MHRACSSRSLWLATILCAGLLIACSSEPTGTRDAGALVEVPRPALPVLATFEELANVRFAPAVDSRAAPRLEPVSVPRFPGSYAIWGATGRDARGHIWIGASAYGARPASAHLLEYIPEERRVIDRGDVVSELQRAAVYRPGEGQMKIHSRIVQLADGHLYFASSDEAGEVEDGGKLPTWGSHLWRLRLPEYRWEHLLAAREGVIAVAGFGARLYALGYFGHMLYQFDGPTGAIRSMRVGSVGGHISRNLFADEFGAVYVPRLTYKGAGELTATLVQLDSMLDEIGETPLVHYADRAPLDSHGIVGFTYLPDRTIVFVTHHGFLYRVTPHENRPAAIAALGWFHPGGESYTASLFALDDARYVGGISTREDRLGWLVYDLVRRSSTATPIVLPKIDGRAPQNVALYGSITRDNAGGFYVAGTYAAAPDKSAPILLRVDFSR